MLIARPMAGGTGHYLNSRVELGSGVLDLIRPFATSFNRPPPAFVAPALLNRRFEFRS